MSKKRLYYMYQLMLFIALIFTSCNQITNSNNSVDKWLSKVSTEFDTEKQVIIDKQVCNYDLKLSISSAFFNDANDDINGVNYEIQFYNYGSDIKLCENLIDDIFTGVYTGVNAIYRLEKNDIITFLERNINPKYGDWAMAKLTIGNKVINNVLITPLSLKAYDNDNEDNLIFIQFYSKKNNKAMNVLFNAENMSSFVIKNHPRKIIRNSVISPEEGEGRFWFSAN